MAPPEVIRTNRSDGRSRRRIAANQPRGFLRRLH
jgi:hypothetical protein